MSKTFVFGAVALCAAVVAQGAVVYTTPASSYTQNFDTLTTGTTSQAWSNDSTLTGWHLFRQPAPGTAITTYVANDGTGNAGSFISYGTAGTTERALGGLGSGGTYFGSPASNTVAGWIALSITNGTGSTLTGFTLGFDGEQWRNGGNTAAQTMVLEYGFGASFDTVATWTAPGGTFDWTSVVNASAAAAVNGNVAGLVTGRGGSVTTSWSAGDTLWVRWAERNDSGNDHGLAIDNVSFTAVPAPGVIALAGSGLLIMARRRRG